MSYGIDWIGEAIDMTRAHHLAGYDDPNAGIHPDTLELALRLSLFPFSNVRIEPETLVRSDTNQRTGFLLARLGEEAHLVHVRVTLGAEQADGVGPLPWQLVTLAREYGAKPHPIRIHLTPRAEGTAVAYFGHEELLQEFMSSEYWRRALIGRRTARDYLRLAGGNLSRLEASVWQQKPGKWPGSDRDDTPEEKMLRKIFGEENQPRVDDFPGAVHLELRIDTLPGWEAKRAVSLSALLASTYRNAEHFIFSCTCGEPGCASVWRGVETVHEDGLVVWRIRGLSPRRVAVFGEEQYRQEVFRVIHEALAVHRQLSPQATLGANDRPQELERALHRAEKDFPAVHVEHHAPVPKETGDSRQGGQIL